MSQSGLIFGAFVLAFIVFITMNGHLPQYLQLLGIGNQSSNTNAAPTNTTVSQTAAPTNNTLVGNDSTLPGLNTDTGLGQFDIA